LKRKKAAYAESSSEEDTPLASSPTKSVADSISDIVNAAVVSSTNGNHQKKKQTRKQEDSNEDDFDVPTQRKRAPISRKAKVPPHKRVKEERHKEQFDSEDDDKPLEPKKVSFGQKHRVTVSSNGEPSSKDKMSVVKRKTKKARLKQSKEDEDMSGSETPRKKITMEQPEGSPKKKSKGKKKDEDEDDEVFRWWEVGDPNGDGSVKWQTLEHNGVIFPPPYEPLPSHVKMKYNGEYRLPSSCRATYFLAVRETGRLAACRRRGCWVLWCYDRD
jgi:DNA topoisomerase-1